MKTTSQIILSCILMLAAGNAFAFDSLSCNPAGDDSHGFYPVTAFGASAITSYQSSSRIKPVCNVFVAQESGAIQMISQGASLNFSKEDRVKFMTVGTIVQTPSGKSKVKQTSELILNKGDEDTSGTFDGYLDVEYSEQDRQNILTSCPTTFKNLNDVPTGFHGEVGCTLTPHDD